MPAKRPARAGTPGFLMESCRTIYDGRQKTLALGIHPDVSLDKARVTCWPIFGPTDS